MTNVEKFRPGSAIASGWVLIVFFLGFIIQSFFYGGDILVTIGICGAGAFGSYLLFLKPYVLLFDEGIKIVNPTKEITATWDLVESRLLTQPKRSPLRGIWLRRSRPSTACPSRLRIGLTTPGLLQLRVVDTVEE
jgi:hypothetical protein